MQANDAVAIGPVDFWDPVAVDDYLDLLDAYARDRMGAGAPLSEAVRMRLPRDLADNPRAHALLARTAGRPVGFATCFVGYSTFRAMPLLNIHDIAVLPEARGRGVGTALISAITTLAGHLGCCRLTLEVRTDNPVALRLYERGGFVPSACSLFMEKPIGQASPDGSGDMP
jgi:ribosomal protein S18 acetylase RimI-like enzyme